MMQREPTGRDRSPSARGALGSMLLTATRMSSSTFRVLPVSVCEPEFEARYLCRP